MVMNEIERIEGMITPEMRKALDRATKEMLDFLQGGKTPTDKAKAAGKIITDFNRVKSKQVSELKKYIKTLKAAKVAGL